MTNMIEESAAEVTGLFEIIFHAEIVFVFDTK